MFLPDRARFGRWGNYGYHDAFRSIGWWVGPSLGEVMPGKKFHQDLPEGRLNFKMGVLYRPDLDKRNKLEKILILLPTAPKVLEAMWSYNTWEKDNDYVDPSVVREAARRVPTASDPW